MGIVVIFAIKCGAPDNVTFIAALGGMVGVSELGHRALAYIFPLPRMILSVGVLVRMRIGVFFPHPGIEMDVCALVVFSPAPSTSWSSWQSSLRRTAVLSPNGTRRITISLMSSLQYAGVGQ